MICLVKEKSIQLTLIMMKISKFVAKVRIFKEFGLYICISHFFFVSLRPNLLCAYAYMCAYTSVIES